MRVHVGHLRFWLQVAHQCHAKVTVYDVQGGSRGQRKRIVEHASQKQCCLRMCRIAVHVCSIGMLDLQHETNPCACPLSPTACARPNVVEPDVRPLAPRLLGGEGYVTWLRSKKPSALGCMCTVSSRVC